MLNLAFIKVASHLIWNETLSFPNLNIGDNILVYVLPNEFLQAPMAILVVGMGDVGMPGGIRKRNGRGHSIDHGERT